MIEYDDIDIEDQLEATQAENERLRQQLAEYQQIGAEAATGPHKAAEGPSTAQAEPAKPKTKAEPEWKPPSHADVQAETDELFAAHARGEIGEADVYERVNRLHESTVPPATPAPDPNAGKSYADLAAETAEAFKADSESEVMAALMEAGAVDESKMWRMGVA